MTKEKAEKKTGKEYFNEPQARMQVECMMAERLEAAMRVVDSLMGDGTADLHPQLVAAVLTSSSIEYLSTYMDCMIHPALESIAGAIERRDE